MDDTKAEGGTGDAYEALRDRYWELAGIEGVTLEAFVTGEIAGGVAPERVDLLRRLVDDVLDTALKNIASKADEEGGIYGAMAEERIEEVGEERARLMALLDRSASAGRPGG